MIILRKQEKKEKGLDIAGKYLYDTQQMALFMNQYKIGFAVDIGTTTIAMYAVELAKGNVIGELSQTNEQTKLGADVMMRIMHAVSGKADKLHQMIVKQVEEMASDILSKLGEQYQVRNEEICFSIVGNTTMCHLFLNRRVDGLAGYPFKAAYKGGVLCLGSEIGMKTFLHSQIKVLPGIAAHVGSDAMAVIGKEQMFDKEVVQLAIDLGTNAEIMLNKKGKVSVCSTAAGPAFEGKGVACGMAAKKGAINGIRIAANNGNIILEIIESQKPLGICGSGLIDVIAQLRKCKVLTADGYLLSREEAFLMGIHQEICEQIVIRENQHSFMFYSDKDSSKEVYITQGDIRNIQLAKGAIQAGIQSLLKAGGITLEQVDEVIVAGVLGNCLRPANAINIGLLPDVLEEKLHFVGNAAGKGALLALLDMDFMNKMEEIAQRIWHLELAQEKDFQSNLMNAMDFKKWS